MRKNIRDDFSVATIKILERRVNGKCSNPECRIPTSGPTVIANKANNVGVGAHIEAAAPGGPRYNMQMTSEQRASIENAIWLCANCAGKIDRDVELYTVAVLAEWKKEAENCAAAEFGVVPVSRKDYMAMEAVVFGGFKKTVMNDALSRIARLSSAEMEKIDPRFQVDVEFKSGVTSYTLNPKFPVEKSFSVRPENSDEFLEKYDEFINHGIDFEIDSSAISFTGSPLFDFKKTTPGKIFLKTHARNNAIMKLAFVRGDGSVLMQADDIHGEFISGQQSVTFRGMAFGGVISITQMYNFSSGSKKTSSINALVEFDSWYGHSLLTLPYFDKAFRFYDLTRRGSKIKTTVEIDGTEIVSGKGEFSDDETRINTCYQFFRYIRNCRALLKILGKDTDFTEDFCATAEEAEFVEYIYQIVCCQPMLKGDELASSKVELTVGLGLTDSEISLIGSIPSPIKIESDYDFTLNLFGIKFDRPRIAFTYTDVTLEKPKEVLKLIAGHSYKMRILPSNDCEFFAKLLLAGD